MNQQSATPDKHMGQSSKDSPPFSASNVGNISSQASNPTSITTATPDEDVSTHADLARSAWGTDQIPTYVSPFSPLFDTYEVQGPGQHSNDCQTFYEATDDMHLYQLWPQEKIICYIEEVVIIENHFASDDDCNEQSSMWTDGSDEEKNICFVKGGGISADMEPYIKRTGTTWSKAWPDSPPRRMLPPIAVEVGKMIGWMAQTDAPQTVEKEEKKERSARYLATNRTPFYPGHPIIRQPRFMSDITEEESYDRRQMGRPCEHPVEGEDTEGFELAASDDDVDAGHGPAVGDEDGDTSSRAQEDARNYAEYGSNSTTDMTTSEDEASSTSDVPPEVISFRRPPRFGPAQNVRPFDDSGNRRNWRGAGKR